MEKLKYEIELPGITVIVPVYNDEHRIGLLMESLLQQDYPSDLVEIIVIDNQSTDRTIECVRRYPVTLLEETTERSSYAARNKGIQHAKHGILAFIDSDCIASPDWLREGVRILVEQDADLVGGKVQFFFSKCRTAAEIYDSLTYLKFESSIRERKTCGTANLFVSSDAFKKVGLFPAVKSGGDVQWTGMASQQGLRLAFAPKAVVRHPARMLGSLLQKGYRVGCGSPAVWRSQGRPVRDRVEMTLRSFIPPRPSSLAQKMQEHGMEDMRRHLPALWSVTYLWRLSTGVGILSGLIGMRKCGKGIHVLMVTKKFPPFPPAHFGGGAIQASYLAAELVRQGVAVQFIADNDDGPTVPDVYNGLPVYRFSTFLKLETKAKEAVYLLRLLWFIATHPEYRIIHFHSILGTESLLFPLLRLMGRMILVKLTLVDNDDPMALRRRKLGRFFRWGLSFVDHFAVISRRLCELASEAGIPAERISLISNGVDTNRFQRPSTEERRTLRDQLGLSEDAVLFLSVGKIEPRKGYDFLLQAWQYIQSVVHRPVLIIAGPGNGPKNPFYQTLTETIRELQLKWIRFVGQVGNVETYMRSADCFLFCSRQEGFGTVLIEAMASGVPVVARHIEHVTEDILIEPALSQAYRGESPGEFARMAAAAVGRPDTKERILAAERIRRRFDIRQIADRYIELYKRLNEGHSQDATPMVACHDRENTC